MCEYVYSLTTNGNVFNPVTWSKMEDWYYLTGWVVQPFNNLTADGTTLISCISRETEWIGRFGLQYFYCV